ncbi:MAG: PAS domain S-box protein [Cyanobacteriota bacterium]
MAKSPDYLPSDSTTAQGVIDSHLLSVQMTVIDQIAGATLGKLVFDQVLHSIALQLQDALQANCCLIVQSDQDSNNSRTKREAREGLKAGQDKRHVCQGDFFLSTSFTPSTSPTLLSNPEPLVRMATTPQENRVVPSDQDSRLYRVCRDFYDYYDSWLAQGKLVIMPASEQHIPQVIWDWVTECGLSQFLMVPLINSSSYLGGIALYQYEHHREWTQQEISFVQAIADQCAIALTVTALQQRHQTEHKTRQESERVLQESQRRLRAICSQTCQLLGLLTPDGSILEVNQTVLDCAGVQAQALVGHPLWQAPWWLPSVKTYSQLQTAIAAAAAGEYIRYEVDVLTASQRVATLDFSLKPIRDETGQVDLLIFEGRDITDYKQTQSELQATLARNRALLEAIPDLIFRVTRDGIYIDWKAAKENTLPLQTHEIIGKHLHQVLPTKLAGLLWHHVELALETNETQLIEYQLWVNGKSHNLEIRLVKSGADEVVVTVQDVTERIQTRVALEQLNDVLESRVEQRTSALKEANRTLREEIIERKRIEGTLRATEERFRQAVVNAPFPIMIHAEDGEVLQINQVWTELTGYTHDEIPTISDWTQKALGEQQEKMRSLIAQLYNLNDRVDQGEFTVTTQEGANRIWYFSSAPLGQLPDSRRLIISMATDITERKQAEAEVKFLHSITQAIFECQDFHAALSVAIQKVCEATGWDFGEAWVPQADGGVLECSPAWYGKTESLVPFRNASEKLTFSPGTGLPGRVWVSQQPEWRRDVSADSHQIYLRAQLAKEAGLKAALGIPLLTTNGLIAVLVFYMFESRDEDQRLIELISASTELGLMIQRKQVEGEIRKALEKEKELTELKSRFITMTSHEFRTPLTTIHSSAELLEHYSKKWSEEKKQTHLNRIQLSVKHMTKLLDDVLVIGKADAGKLSLNPVPLDLENFCKILVEELQLNDKNEHNINFTFNPIIGDLNGENELKDSRLKIESYNKIQSSSQSNLPCLDEQLLWQILDNLLSNAMKYSPRGSTVKLTLQCFCDRAIFKICDRGIGIPKEDQPRLFETFHRATNVGTIAGTGLGLAIVKKCVDIHQGQIAVESEVGVGTTFTVTLPIYNSPLTHEEDFSH